MGYTQQAIGHATANDLALNAIGSVVGHENTAVRCVTFERQRLVGGLLCP